jgi:two-component system, NarL family, invasion response regulator UvrY
MLRILIADDHPVVRQGLKRILLEEFSPVHIEEAENTNLLIEKAMEGSWDLVISDLAMPGGGGIVALKKIKLMKKDLPILIVSTYPAEQYESRVIKAGASFFVK